MKVQEDWIFQRAELLLGTENLERLSHKKVIIFGIGGVGSWCAEALVRTGITQLTIVDSDTICLSNVNRQLHATTETIDHPKTEVLKRRLMAINPDADIVAMQQRYTEETSVDFQLNTYDYIIDAIDSLSSKINLIQTATQTNAVFFSSMGAALKMDPSRIRTAEFWKTHGCPLAAVLRRKIRREGLPVKKFHCVFSDELVPNKKEGNGNGTVVHITAIFGFTLAGLVIQDICNE